MAHQYNYLIIQEAELPKNSGITLTETNKKIIMNEVKEHNYSRKLRYNMSISTHNLA